LNKAISVDDLNNQLKALLETTFCTVYVQGEISNLTYHNSGHIYFSIKDKNSTISCVMFRGNATKLKFRLEVGAKIIINGSITVYTPRGNYQLLCSSIEPEGIGALALAYEQLRTKLQIKGYFNKALKKELPKYPQTVYVITSNTGAAIEDMKKILSHRYPLCKMVLIPTLVQGDDAKYSIVASIKKAQEIALHSSDLSFIIVGRGGGSIEDLWAFNEQIVADAIYECTIPIISAVGHESDFVISDEVADIRASTPSNAIEISTPNINDLRLLSDNIYNDMQKMFKTIVYNKEQELNYLMKSFSTYSISSKFAFIQNDISQSRLNLNRVFKQKLNEKEQELGLLNSSFRQNNPQNKQKKSYIQVTKENRLIDIGTLEENDEIQLQSINNIFHCKIITKEILS
jgi:exodeoxyribonuclease VII large subunit